MATKITLRPKGATDDSYDVVLSDGADRSSTEARGPADLSPTVTFAEQIFRGIRRDNALHVGRGNRDGSMPLSTSRTFDTAANAGRFCLTHGMAVPAEGTLIFDFGDSGTLVALHGAVIRQIGALSWKGCVVLGSYQIGYSGAASVAAADLAGAIADFESAAIRRRINCGADVSVPGWNADTYDYGGAVNYHAAGVEIENAGQINPDVYRRYVAKTYSPGAKIEYSLPIVPGNYTLKLHFMTPYETDAAVFDVLLFGSVVVADYSVLTAAGAAFKACVLSVEVVQASPELVIALAPKSSGKVALLSAIEVIESEE